eukprot:gb/GECH01004628.1/.p1 GENE.gb/GECH01004628.1/~~gb/GECH01004628.1/.p1  ORF type:complete len:115 (+),score=6.26 gb/GECH01004628.1/:1-345(+)
MLIHSVQELPFYPQRLHLNGSGALQNGFLYYVSFSGFLAQNNFQIQLWEMTDMKIETNAFLISDDLCHDNRLYPDKEKANLCSIDSRERSKRQISSVLGFHLIHNQKSPSFYKL